MSGKRKYFNDEKALLSAEEEADDMPLHVLHDDIKRNDGSDSVYTVGDAIEYMGIGRIQYIMLTAIALSALSQGMDVTFLSILPSKASCAYNLDSLRRAFLSTIYFIGTTLGAFAFGYFGDRWGRKVGVMICLGIVAYVSILVCFSYDYAWLAVLRGITGFGIGGFSLRNSWMFEMLPTAYRVRSACLVLFFWTAGTSLDVPILLIPGLHWKYAMLVTMSPLFIVIVLLAFVPESPRLMLHLGFEDEAMETLEKISRWNGTPLPPGQLVTEKEKDKICVNGVGRRRRSSRNGNGNGPVERAKFIDLFKEREMRITTILLSFIWFSLFFADFGMYIMTSEIFQLSHLPVDLQSAANIHCTPLSRGDLISIMLTSVSSFPGLMLFFLMMDWTGRRKAIAINSFAAAVLLGVLLIPGLKRAALTALLSAMRAVMTASFKVLLVYTPEVYPTRLRSRGNGFQLALGQAGTVLTPFAAQVLLRQSAQAGEGLYLGFCVLAGVAALLLPIETQGRALKD